MTADPRRSPQGWASLAIAGLALVLVIAGLALGGGPSQARKERRDSARLDDLNRLALHVECLSREGNSRVMPAALTETEACPGPLPLTDTATGAAYRFERVDDVHYRLCADFELPPQAIPNRYRFGRERDGDCIARELPPVPETRPDAAVQADVLPAN